MLGQVHDQVAPGVCNAHVDHLNHSVTVVVPHGRVVADRCGRRSKFADLAAFGPSLTLFPRCRPFEFHHFLPAVIRVPDLRLWKLLVVADVIAMMVCVDDMLDWLVPCGGARRRHQALDMKRCGQRIDDHQLVVRRDDARVADATPAPLSRPPRLNVGVDVGRQLL